MTQAEKYTETRTFDSDSPLQLLGVPGRIQRRTVGSMTNIGCWEHQDWISERRTKVVNGETIVMHAEVRFDDSCHNGHNTFSITGFGWYGRYKSRDYDFCGCCHGMIEQVFPELAPLIKWHLVSTNSPMHYVANAVHFASDRDCWGRAKGEPRAWETHVQFGTFPITFQVSKKFLEWLQAALEHRKTTPKTNPHRKEFEVVEVAYVPKGQADHAFAPKYSLDDFTTDWYTAPFDSKAQALEWQAALRTEPLQAVRIVTAYSEGKEREFDKARSAAKWPEATDEQLSLPKEELTALLEARLPALQADFRNAMTEAGLYWSPEEYK